MGVVYRAQDLQRDGLHVAVKLLLDADANPKRLERFLREGQIVKELEHPGIVRLVDLGDTTPPYLVYELVRGARTLLDAFPRFERDERVRLVLETARALGHAHERGVLHRDVKLENVLVDGEGRARLTDFGLAAASGLSRLTRSNAMVGTPFAMSPEQVAAKRDEFGPWTDVWGLGVMLYQALTDRFPFQGETLADLAAEICWESPPSPSLTRGVSPQLASVCLRALEKAPSRRYQDGSRFADALESAFAASPRRGLSTRAVVGGLLVSLVAGGLVLALLAPLTPDEALASGKEQPGARASASPQSELSPTPTSSLRFLEERGERGDPAALVALAQRRYLDGEFVEAASLYQRAAGLGSPGAMYNLGVMLEAGRGVPRDERKARDWYAKAGEAGEVKAMVLLGDMFARGRGGARDLTEAVAWFERGARGGDPLAMSNLAYMLESGTGTPRDQARAVEWYREAAKAGDAEAMCNLAALHLKGLGEIRSDRQAFKLFHAAAKAGHARGMRSCGTLLQLGQGTAQDLTAAAHWYRTSAERGDPVAATYLAALFETGSGVDRDLSKAIAWYRRAAKGGDLQAMRRLGLLLRQAGPPEARRWLEEAAGRGDVKAKELLQELLSQD